MPIQGKLVFIEPEQHDLEYGSCVARKTEEEIAETIETIPLRGSEANPSNCADIINAEDPIHVWGVGHGNENVYSVECTNIWLDARVPSSLDPLIGRVVHLLSCTTAKNLGPALIEHGSIAYFGYYDSFWFMITESPCGSRMVKSAHTCDLEIERSLSKGRTTGQAKEDCLARFDEEITYWENSDDPYAADCVWCLETDKALLRLYGDETITITTPFPIPIIRVYSTPTEANIYLDGNYIGKTNSSYNIDPGTHTLRLTLEGYYDYEETFTISEWETKTLDIALEHPKSYINVNSTPPEAKIYLDDTNIGKTNNSFEINSGTHTLKLTLKDYYDYEETFVIAEGETKIFDIILEEIPPEYIKDKEEIFTIKLATLLEGFLKITSIDIPSEAKEGNIVNFNIHTQNSGGDDNFKVELSGDAIGSQEFSLEANATKDVDFSFTMPNHDVTITVTTYHWE